MSYLLRVSLPDRPGSLGALALALGTVSADIVSLDVVDRFAGAAVDDIVVEVPTGTLPDTLITAAENVDGVVVDSVRPFDGILAAHRELEFVDAVSTAGAVAPRMVAEAIPTVLRVDWALILEVTASVAVVVAASEAAPGWDGVRIPALEGLTRAVTPDPADLPERWTLMDTGIAAAPLAFDHVLVVGRLGGPSFRRSEVARLGHLAGILRALHSA